MKGKLACLIGLTICGIGLFAYGKHLKSLEQEPTVLDAELEALRQYRKELFKVVVEYQQKTNEEVRKVQELLKELNGIDPMKIDIQIDPE